MKGAEQAAGMGERELQPLSGVQSRVKVCCDVLSHQHRGLPASGKLITPVTASKPHPTCLAMPPLKCCYCFCLPTRGQVFSSHSGLSGKAGNQGAPLKGKATSPNPAGLFQRPRQEAQTLHCSTGPNLPCLVSFCPHQL